MRTIRIVQLRTETWGDKGPRTWLLLGPTGMSIGLFPGKTANHGC